MTTKTNKPSTNKPVEKMFNIVQTFGKESVSAHSKAEVAGQDRPGMFTPDIDPDYVFRKELMTDVMAWWQIGDGEPLFLSGPSGSGKSSLVRQIAARLNLNVQHMVGHGRLEFPEMVTTMHIINGNTKIHPGPLALAMMYGMIFLYDEADLVAESTNAALNEVLQGRPLIIPETGQIIKPHPRFRFIATGNSHGGRDDTGLYQGIVQQNMAFMERFWHLKVEYPTPEVELGVLKRAFPTTPEALLKAMIDVANDVRAAFMGVSQGGEACEVTLSTRTLKRWAKVGAYYAPFATQGISPYEHALERVLLNRATPETAQFIRGLVQRTFGGVK